MKINYNFINGESTQVEVSDEIAEAINEIEKYENRIKRKEEHHNYSLDSFDYEGDVFACIDTDIENIINSDETPERVKEAFAQLTPLQQQRILRLAEGYSIRQISSMENKDYKTVYESIEAARKKFLKFFLKTPHQNEG